MPEIWEAHLEGMFESLQPDGYHEKELAGRIAEILWRLRRKQAEEGMGVLLTRLLERTAAMVLSEQSEVERITQGPEEGNDQGDNHDRNNQEFLAFLNDVMAHANNSRKTVKA